MWKSHDRFGDLGLSELIEGKMVDGIFKKRFIYDGAMFEPCAEANMERKCVVIKLTSNMRAWFMMFVESGEAIFQDF